MKLDIKKIKSPKVSKSSKKNKKYQDFLGNGTKDVKKSKDKRVIQVKRKIHSPKKSKKVIQDINDIEQKMYQMKTNQINIQMPTQNKSSEIQSKVQPQQPKVQSKVQPQQPKVQSKVQPQQPKVQSKVQPQQPKVQSKVQPKVPKKGVPRIRRSNRRSTHRKKSKIHGRKVSVKSRVFNKKDIQRVENKIKEIRGIKTDDIKKELKSQGIKVSGKSDRLLKDIYLYSKMCNINIQHEK